ncbi:unnamed protein product [Linum trigynum]|uniref:Uncharacterized protein n=1 Tax=Linum trigynum TaxID=586398 RepID=A0AAV2CWN6_9ROSI
MLGRFLTVAMQEVLRASLHNQSQWCKPGSLPDQETFLASNPGRRPPEKGFWGAGQRGNVWSQSRAWKRKSRWLLVEWDINPSVRKKSRSAPRKVMWRFKLPSSDDMVGDYVPSYESFHDIPRKTALSNPSEIPTSECISYHVAGLQKQSRSNAGSGKMCCRPDQVIGPGWPERSR